MPDVFANNRSILHSGDGLQHVAAPPDVCKTPSPGGPVPIPYPNMAMDSDLAKGTKKVKINGNPVATETSNLSTSTGDEAGTAGGGVVSSKFKGKLTWGGASTDVKAEGNGVARFMDVTQHNGNSFNTAFTAMGSPNTGAAYADDFVGKCDICNKGKNAHRIYETKSTVAVCKEVIEACRARLAALLAGPASAENEKQLEPWSRGFMVGVMICKCDPGKAWVAKSGYAFEDFLTTAKTAKVHKVIPGGPVKLNELVDSNKFPRVPRVRKELCLDRTWNEVNRIRGEKPKRPGYNPPGNCAAAKLLARADGHAPLEMTEMFFDPKAGSADAWKARYLWRINNQPMRTWMEFKEGQTVASCHTCQMLLYMTNCPVRTCP